MIFLMISGNKVEKLGIDAIVIRRSYFQIEY